MISKFTQFIDSMQHPIEYIISLNIRCMNVKFFCLRIYFISVNHLILIMANVQVYEQWRFIGLLSLIVSNLSIVKIFIRIFIPPLLIAAVVRTANYYYAIVKYSSSSFTTKFISALSALNTFINVLIVALFADLSSFDI